MAKAASTSEEYQKATDADKAAKRQHEEMQKLQDLEKELTDKLNVKRAHGERIRPQNKSQSTRATGCRARSPRIS